MFKPPTPSEIAAILARFRPDIERAQSSRPDADPTIEDGPTTRRRTPSDAPVTQRVDSLGYEDTLEVPRGAPRAPDERIGLTIAGKYRLVRVLGEGGMGTVFEAQHLGLDKRVAVKIVAARLLHDADVTARFLREARAACAVVSEHIVHVFDVGEDLDAGVYMVMELLRGCDLATILSQRGRLRSEEAAGIAFQIVLALTRAHAAGIVHRDLKPANVFLAEVDDGAIKVKVLDFGLAKPLRDASESAEGAMTRRGLVIGTPQYMSPEQARALPTVDARTDLYSLGAVLFECVTGEPAYPEASSDGKAVLAIATQPAPRASSVRPDVDPTLDQLIADLMEHDPDARPKSLADVRERLTRVHPEVTAGRLKIDAPAGARLVSLEGERRVAARRRRWTLAAVLAGLAAVAAVALVVRTRGAGAPEAAGPSAPPPSAPSPAPHEGPATGRAESNRLVQQAIAALAERDPARAVLLCRSATERDPSNGSAWITLGHAYDAEGVPDAEARAASECRRRLPTDADRVCPTAAPAPLPPRK